MSGEDGSPLHILMLCPLRYTAAMAFVVESIVGFATRGHRVDVLVSERAEPPFQCDHSHVRICRVPDPATSPGTWYLQFWKAAHRCARTCRYGVTIGVSQVGLVAAAGIQKRFGIPCVFYNDEIWFGNERHGLLGNAFGHLMKWWERRANRGVLFTVTQDPERGRFVMKTNRISRESLRYLPNSRAGCAQRLESKYMHRRFGFPDDTRIVLWMGAVSPGDGALELAREAASWPDGYRMVFHFRTASATPYMRQIMERHGGGRTYVSHKPIPYDEIDEMAGSATVGLGMYADKGINARYIGASSGKINSLLKAGVPCIVSDFEGLRWVEESGAGLCIKKPSEVFPAAARIIGDLETFRRRSIETFESRLRFDKAFAAIAEEIEGRVRRNGNSEAGLVAD